MERCRGLCEDRFGKVQRTLDGVDRGGCSDGDHRILSGIYEGKAMSGGQDGRVPPYEAFRELQSMVYDTTRWQLASIVVLIRIPFKSAPMPRRFPFCA